MLGGAYRQGCRRPARPDRSACQARLSETVRLAWQAGLSPDRHWRSQDFIVGGAKLRPIQPVGGGGGGGGGGAVRCRPILRGGGGGGGGLSAVGRFYERGGEEGVAVRCRPIQLVCAVRFNKWEVRMKARGGQLHADVTVQA